MDELGAEHPPGPTDAARETSLADNRWAVLALVFLAAGALGIPLIWLSRAFSRPVKILLTILVTVYTALMLWLVWLVLVACYHHVVDAI